MTLGPPASAAGPSHPPSSSVPGTTTEENTTVPPTHRTQPPSYTASALNTPQAAPHPYHSQATSQASSTAPLGSLPQQSPHAPNLPYAPTGYYSQYPSHPGVAQQPQAAGYPYYGFPQSSWPNAWGPGTYRYPSNGYSYSYATPAGNVPLSAAAQAASTVEAVQEVPSPSPPTPPPPEFHKDWDAVVKTFLSTIGFSQALRGFEADMVVLNPEWERRQVPVALEELTVNIEVRPAPPQFIFFLNANHSFIESEGTSR